LMICGPSRPLYGARGDISSTRSNTVGTQKIGNR
jgi:hypothetical protein